MEILFEDNHLLALVKPPHLVTQKTLFSQDSLEERGKRKIQEKKKKSGNIFLHPIHRLDKEVSGIVLFALTRKALSRLQAQQRERKIEKRYLAWVEGTFPQEKGKLKHYLIKKEHKAFVDKRGKESVLAYSLLKKEKEKTLLEIELKTGRYHQIRVQLSHIGHPIVGDRKYGSKTEASQIVLHHYQMIFFHPTTQQKVILLDKKGKTAMEGFFG